MDTSKLRTIKENFSPGIFITFKMKSEECKAILTPMFESFEKNYYAGQMEKSIEDNFHTDAVAVHKGVGALYGKKAITEGFSKLSDEYGKVKFAAQPQHQYNFVRMKPDEVKAILKPLYDAMEKTYYDGHMEKAVTDFFHPDGVVVQRGVEAQYGIKSALEGFGKMAEEFGKVKFSRSNETFCGCECCLVTAYDVTLESEKKGRVKAKVFQIWKKDGGKWKIYHDEFEILTK